MRTTRAISCNSHSLVVGCSQHPLPHPAHASHGAAVPRTRLTELTLGPCPPPTLWPHPPAFWCSYCNASGGALVLFNASAAANLPLGATIVGRVLNSTRLGSVSPAGRRLLGWTPTVYDKYSFWDTTEYNGYSDVDPDSVVIPQVRGRGTVRWPCAFHACKGGYAPAFWTSVQVTTPPAPPKVASRVSRHTLPHTAQSCNLRHTLPRTSMMPTAR